jgi:ubiquinone/menaquinone biosynthesis C-methylase UbiE
MRTEECVALVRAGVAGGGPAWADLGSGTGAFTAALAEILGPGADLVSVDTDRRGLQSQARELPGRYPQARFQFAEGDFTTDLALAPRDGILVANALHFHRDHCAVLRGMARWLKPGGRLVVVEYDLERPSGPWVPHPLPRSALAAAAACAGLGAPRFLAERPSRYHRGALYSALLLTGPMPR